ncbi:methyltransferase domain-containing protein [Amphritea sp. 1_MG-2023]|uniref:class I SAM-dependent methyltransferase n=1 Tax=Amphritea sp. 1_MG-2023 TaxID=3062670 RepID=UPI0026E406F6|nr:methyltransferase domain-containing protein [Amphritea sp. 1_MG-2023]MDO6562213.1 methyltransferase domain-containing protein [Amphritea sp. 1_MG-2023]
MDIDQHYSHHADEAFLLQQLRQRYPDGPSSYQLAPLDQLHIGGIKASEKLLQQLQHDQPHRILEIGSGVGGLMRMLNAKTQIEVVGIDITHRFNRLNQAISALTSPPTSPQLITCDARQLPFADNHFDCIIFQHSLLNIPHTDVCLQECRRILSRHGSLLLHEVLQGPNPHSMRYPVPWASNAQQSHLLTFEAISALLQQHHFKLEQAENWSSEALQWRHRQQQKETSVKPPSTLSPANILGQSFSQMGANVITNLNTGAVEVWQLSCRGQTL